VSALSGVMCAIMMCPRADRVEKSSLSRFDVSNDALDIVTLASEISLPSGTDMNVPLSAQ
jgi:hypothetical protein